MADAALGAAATLYPLVVDYAHAECGWCADVSADLLDLASGKTRHHFQLVLDAAIKGQFDELVVLVAARSPRRALVEKVLKRKKHLHQLRVSLLEIPPSALPLQAHRLRWLATTHAALLAKGLVYLDAHSLPVDDLKAFALDFKKLTRKWSALAITLLATPDKLETGTGHVVMYEKRTGELLGFGVYDRHQPSTLRLREFCEENKRVLNLSEASGTVASTLKLSFHHFVANQKLIEGLISNADFPDVQSFVSDALSKPVELDGIRIHVAKALTTTRNTQVTNLRQLKTLLLKDSTAASDAIELEGNRSYWQRVGTDSVKHESVKIPETLASLQNVVLMRDVEIADSVTELRNCVIAPGARVAANCADCYIGADVNINAPVLDGPSLLLTERAAAPLRPPYQPSWIESESECGPGVKRFHCSARWQREHLSPAPDFSSLSNDPSEDVEKFLDELYDIREEETSSAPLQPPGGERRRVLGALDAEFDEEVVELLRAAEAGHMQDLVLELRTLRLTENKRDGDLLRSVARLACETVRDEASCGFKSADQISALLGERELTYIIDAFCTDRESRFGFYQGLVDYLEAVGGGSDQFVVMISSMEDVLHNEDHLRAFLEALDQPLPACLRSDLIDQYLAWLDEPPSSSEESSAGL